MPKTKVVNGKTFIFPDDATDEEMSSLTAAPKETPKMSAMAPVAGRPDLALPPSMVDALGQKKLVSPEISEFMTTPLAKPTGIESVDSFLSPAGLASLAISEGPAVARAVGGAVTNLTNAVGDRLAGKILKFVTPSLLKKPAELASILGELAEASRSKPAMPAAPEAPPPAVAAPAAAQPQTAQPQAAQPVPEAPQAPAAQTVTRAIFRPGEALQAAKDAFKALGQTPRPAEASNAMELIRRGASPTDAVSQIIKARPVLSPAEELAQRFNARGLNDLTPLQRLQQDLLQGGAAEAEFARKYAAQVKQ